MGLPIVPIASALAGAVGITTVALVSPADVAVSGPDIWAAIQTGGAPMALVMFLALIEVTRRHDKAYRIIEQKDAVILEMSNRQVDAIKATVEIANDQMKIAQNTELLLRELVILGGRGKVG